MSTAVDSRIHSVTKSGAILGVLIIFVVASFWLGSRYPAIDEKAAMAGDTLLEDVLSFEAKLPVQHGDPLWQQIAYSTLNWSYTNKEGMTFGVILATLILTFLRMTPGRPSSNVFINSVKGTILGAPLGVCVNCSAPIGKGMYKGGASMETSLATMLSSPNLNIIVITMTFSLLPIYMAVSKVVIALLLLLIILPVLVSYVFRPAAATGPVTTDLFAGAGRPRETWTKAVVDTAQELLKSFWYIVIRTVPLMLLAGFLGVTVATLVPLQELADWDVTLPNLALMALVGTFLPVPIAFDVVLVQALLVAGLPAEFAMVLLVTLGSYSIYPFFILWTTMTRRVAVVLFVVIAGLGIASGYFAQAYEHYDTARSNALLEARFADRVPAEVPAAPLAGSHDCALTAAETGPSPSLSSQTVYQESGIRLDAIEFLKTPALLESEPQFARLSGIEFCIVDDRIAVLDLMMPFSQGRGIASGEVDNDGWVDLALAANNGVWIYRNLGTGGFARIPLPQTEHLNVKLVALIDINNDGWQDIYVGAFGDSDYFVLNDQSNFSTAELLPVPHKGALFTEAAAFFDIDKDADLDFVKGHWFFGVPRSMPSVRATNYLVHNHEMVFEQTALDEIVGATLTALISDFNGDSEPDMIVGNDFMEPDIFYVGAGGGQFQQLSSDGPIPISTLATMSVDTGDIDNDLVFDIYMTGKTNDFSTRRSAARSERADEQARRQRNRDATEADAGDGRGDRQTRRRAERQTSESRQRNATSSARPNIQTNRREVQKRQRAFAGQYCVGIEDPSELARCQDFLDKLQITRRRNMTACETLRTEAETDECLVSLQFLKGKAKRDQKMCDRIPDAFPIQKAMCDGYMVHARLADKKPIAYRYLDRGAIDQAMQGNVLLVGSGDGRFTESAKQRGVFDGRWSWNAKFADLDNDEWQDLYVVTGWWLESNIYSSKFFRNLGDGYFEASEEAFGLGSTLKQSSYTYVDIDNDGDLDIVTRAMHGQVNVYVNNEHKNNHVMFELREGLGNRFGIGSKIYIYYGDQRHQVREIKAGSGYLSFDAPYAHFGLGPHEQIDRAKIIWSTGETTVIDRPLAANRKYVVSRPGLTN